MKMLNFELYDQNDKITPKKAREKICPFLTESYLVKKQANVDIKTHVLSRHAIPIPTPAKFCSQIKHSTCLSG